MSNTADHWRSTLRQRWATMSLDKVATSNMDMGATIAGEQTQLDPIDVSELRLLGLLGEGGMGMVHMGEQTALRRKVAVKTLRPGRKQRRHVNRILLEARIIGLLEHPNIIPVYQLIPGATGEPMMVMKRVEGTSWLEVIGDPQHELLVGRADALEFHLQILLQIAGAVHYAHNRGILHRDIKPANVLLGSYHEVYLTDWGISVSNDPEQRGWLPMVDEATDVLVGTPAYMAPEMVGGKVDARTDVYLLGTTLYHVLNGIPPYQGDDLHRVLGQVFMSELPPFPAHVPEALQAICRRAAAREPAQRFANADRFRRAIEGFLQRRSAIELVSQADTQLVRLSALIREPFVDESHRAEMIYRLFGECRFALQQSLRSYPDNAPATTGLQRAYEAMVEYELAQDREEAAARLLAEMASPRPDLEARVAAMRAQRKAEAERIKALEQLERDVDLSVSQGVRSKVAMAIGIFWALPPLIGWILQYQGIYSSQYGDTIMAAAGFFVAAGIVIYRRRNTLFKNRINQRLSMSVLLSALFMVLLRVAAWSAGIPIQYMFLFDIILLTTMFVLIVVPYDFRLLIGAVPWLLSLVVSILAPPFMFLALSLAIASSFTIVSLIWRADDKRAARS